ncbi:MULTISPECIES: TetR/AcrR family transcriptional regulator [unclassified Pseudonocardia]|uniref:TetR/AcrR family transcriptional regulator n=1 Tax=unclassified Pseudonocardia TaxID=2619320 RepID=UPI0001FFEB36|nr:TetR/AcrR family transcriptional regulator [Pseudonocardia sp. Ae707_Ps1]OLM09007.1 Transcriptional regulator, TetR family [Pseudonocardia sp. Ae707_Ps1]
MGSTPPTPRRGRPRAADAAQVAERVLDAAEELFLRQGYARTTVDQITEAAHAGKNTVYARYPTKAALFTAVVERSGRIFAVRTEAVMTGTVRERLIAAGLALADQTLTPDGIGLMRVTAAEANSFPDVAREGFAVGFGQCVHLITRSLPDDRPGGGATVLATRLVEMALHPLYMHAFFGADLADLRIRARDDVPRVVDALLNRTDTDPARPSNV